MVVAWKAQNVSAAVAPAFEAAVVRLINTTADYAATDSVRRFGTGEEAFDETTFPKIYSLAQCTPDMAATACRSCLEDIVGRMVSGNLIGRMGGRVLGVRCNLWFEVYPFFSGRSLLQLPGPSPSPAPPVTAAGGMLDILFFSFSFIYHLPDIFLCAKCVFFDNL